MIDPLIQTGEFKDPVLEPENVANAIVAQILNGKSGQVILPRSLSLVSGARGFPTWLQYMLRSSKADLLRVRTSK